MEKFKYFGDIMREVIYYYYYYYYQQYYQYYWVNNTAQWKGYQDQMILMLVEILLKGYSRIEMIVYSNLSTIYSIFYIMIDLYPQFFTSNIRALSTF